jgi:hypothetical protein
VPPADVAFVLFKDSLHVVLAQARCLSSLGRLKDAINIVRACVVLFEQYNISNSLSRQFRVEFGSMLIDLGSFSEASEFFEKVRCLTLRFESVEAFH